MNQEAYSYHASISGIFDKILQELPLIQQAALCLADVIGQDRLIHVIGPGGHSNIVAEEVFWRAGGLVPVNAVLDPGFNLIHGAKRSNHIERTPGYGAKVLDAYQIGKVSGEILIIANAYGINALCLDLALETRKRGITTIGVTSRSFADRVPKEHQARHPSGKNLYEEVDYFLNCHLPYGDTVVEIEGLEQKIGPTATFCSIFTVNLLMIETIKALKSRNINVPIWMSANLPGGDEANRALEEQYIPRIKHLG